MHLFTDGSVNTSSKMGVGAYLFLEELIVNDNDCKVKTKLFKDTSSTKLELQTLLWALNEVKTDDMNLVIYTDSQNIIGLPNRRERLEKNNFYSKQGKRLKNFEIYKDFFQLMDRLNFRLVKVKGHKPGKQKNDIDKMFTLVDRASRNVLREL